jgi:hypothetical protein
MMRVNHWHILIIKLGGMMVAAIAIVATLVKLL